MSRNVVLPFFAVPPKEYSQEYMNEIVRSFSVYLTQMQNPGEGRNTGLSLTNLQTDDQGLAPGELFNYRDASGMMGFVKIAVADAPNLRGNTATGGVGAATVVIS
jgi:hypothetical protein|tara:strand:+ start:144 stop:458 length:315 start_codon:yes stop_codon:yes gene_type:complete